MLVRLSSFLSSALFACFAIGLMAMSLYGCPPTTPTNEQTTENIPEGGTDEPIGACTDAFRFDSWVLETDRRMIKACSPYIIPETLYITSGATLTIEAGVTVRFEKGYLHVGQFGGEGGLIIRGTANDPVVIESALAAPAAGSWSGVYFSGTTLPNSLMEHVIVRHGGDVDKKACIWIHRVLGGRLKLRNVTMEDCQETGIYIESEEELELRELTFRRTGQYGMSVTPNAVGHVAGAMLYEGVNKNKILGGTVSRDATWIAQDVPWEIIASVIIADTNSPPMLTLEAGTHLRFTQGYLEVGQFGNGGGIRAIGRSDDPILMESALSVPTAGSWSGIYFSSVLPNSVLEHVIVRHAGDADKKACVQLVNIPDDRIALRNVTMEDCQEAGLFLDRGMPKEISNLTFKRTGEFGMKIHPDAVGLIKEAFTYEGVTQNQIFTGEVTRDATWVTQPLPWQINGKLVIANTQSPPMLKIEAGSTLRFTQDYLEVGQFGNGGGLQAIGTASAPVTFESALSSPSPGSWSGIYISDAALGGTRLEHVIVRHAGAVEKKAGVWIDGVEREIVIRNSLFEDNAEYDLWIHCKSNPTLEGNTYNSPKGLFEDDGC
jgi:hypothetical protein